MTTKPFDASLNSLIDDRAQDWAAFLAARAHVPPGPATVLDTDLSATLQADKLFRIDGPSPAVLHLELESTSRLGIPVDLLRYNVVTHHLLRLPVHSILMLLRPKANAGDLTGELIVNGGDGRPYLSFRYSVIRLWLESMTDLLNGPLGLSPLSVVTNEAAADVGGAYTRLDHRLRDERVADNLRKKLLSSALVLGGLRYDRDQLKEIDMSLLSVLRDSVVITDAIEEGKALGKVQGKAEGRAEGKAEGRAEGKAEGRVEGRAEAGQRFLLRFGGKRFGPPPTDVENVIRSVMDLDRLERMSDRVDEASSWDDLLATK